MMRATLEAEFGRDTDDSEDGGSARDGDLRPVDDLFCPACNKTFRSAKA